jgi:Tol biopolymer transport system component
MCVDVSPDGQKLVFDLMGTIYMLPASGGRARAITDERSIDYRPKFSPEGARVAFLSERSGTLNIWMMNADGSAPVMVSSQDAVERPKRRRFFMTPEWTPDGRHLAAAVASDLTYYGSDDVELFPVPSAGEAAGSAETRAPRSLFNRTALDPVNRLIRTAMRGPFPGEGIEPSFSSDGSRMYYSMRTSQVRVNGERIMPQYQVGVLDLASRVRSTLTNRPLGAFSPVVSPDGRWLVYAARDAADAGLRLRDLESGEDRWLIFPIDRDAIESWHTEGLINTVSFFPDSRSIATSFAGKLWRIGIPSGKVAPIPFSAPVRRWLAPSTRARIELPRGPSVHTRYLEYPSLSPDGRRLAFGALNKVWVVDVRGGRPRRLTQERSRAEFHPAWSPDGSKIIYASFSIGERAGSLMEAVVDSPAEPERRTERNGFYSMPGYTPDGARVVAVMTPVTDDLLYSGMPSASIVAIASGGQMRELAPVTPVNGFIRPQVVEAEPTRVYFYQPGAGFSSVALDGASADRRVHLSIRGLGMQGGDPQGREVMDAVLSADGRRLLIWAAPESFGGIYAVSLDPARPASEPTVELSTLEPVKLSGVAGGVFPFLSRSGEAFYLIADQVFRARAGSAPQHSFDIAVREPARPGVAPLLLTNARIVTMEGAKIIDRGELLVEGNKIAALGPAGTLRPRKVARTLDLGGASVLPGLIDTHAHATSPPPTAPPDIGGWQLVNRLAYGVTTLLDPAPSLSLFRDADLIQAGERIGPRVLSSGPVFEPFVPLFSAQDAGDLVRRNARYGAVAIKSYDVGGALNRGWMAEAARRQKVGVVVESEGSFNYTLSLILEGHGHLAHGFAVPIYRDMRELLKRSGVAVSYQFGTLRGEGGPSTLFHFLDREFSWEDPKLRRYLPPAHDYAWWRRITIDPRDQVFSYYSRFLGRAVEEGAHIALGDHGVYLGQGMHWELLAYGSAMPAHRALRSVTIDGAYALGLEHELGSLEAGKRADLIVVDGDPTRDLRDLSKIRYVMRDGELFEAGSLRPLWPREGVPARPWWPLQEPTLRPGGERSGGVVPF